MKTSAIFLICLLASAANANKGKRLGFTGTGESVDEPLLCRMTMIDVMHQNEDGSLSTTSSSGCIPLIDREETDILLPMELPRNIRQTYRQELNKGILRVEVYGAELTEDKVKVTDSTKFVVIRKPYGRTGLTSTGNLSVLIVRVTTSDGVSPFYSMSDMRARIFGSGAGMKSQYDACSLGKLQFQDAGGLEIRLSNPASYYTAPSQFVAETQAAVLALKGQTVDKLADKVMFAFPPGTGNWVATASTNHYRSIYNDKWILSLTATMHEMGHCIGLDHSGVGDNKYNDQTGYMGYGDERSK
jgi:hypothetical protein